MPRPLAPALALALLAAGCVSTGTFEKKEAEAARFKADFADEVKKNQALAEQSAGYKAKAEVCAEAQKLQEERIKATEANLVTRQQELNALKQDNGRLQGQVDELSGARKRLEAAKADLEKRTAEQVDQLTAQQRKLEAAKADLEKKSAEYSQLALSLQTEIEQGRVELTELKGRLTVKMKDKILFASGSATVGKDGLAALAKVAEALRTVQGKVIRVEGHTDNVPTGGTAWPSNWELSTARALAVVRALQERGVDPTRLAAAGYAEFHPIAPNDTAEGKSLNRRIEIVLAAGP
jgi:chemotaxis protein MotB